MTKNLTLINKRISMQGNMTKSEKAIKVAEMIKKKHVSSVFVEVCKNMKQKKQVQY